MIIKGSGNPVSLVQEEDQVYIHIATNLFFFLFFPSFSSYLSSLCPYVYFS